MPEACLHRAEHPYFWVYGNYRHELSAAASRPDSGLSCGNTTLTLSGLATAIAATDSAKAQRYAALVRNKG